MRSKVTIKDVARAAGVAVGTASRVVNGHANVGGDIRVRVESAVARLGYQPNAVARSMRSGRTQAVAVLVRDIAVPLFAEFLSALETPLAQAGYTVLVACTHDDPEREIALLRLFRERKVDGVVMTTVDETDPTLADARALLGAPVIMLDRETEDGRYRLLVDHAEGVRLATERLITFGHQRIGLITGSENVYPGRARILGYRTALLSAGIEFDPAMIHARSFDASEAASATHQMFGHKDPPTALIAGSSSMLPGVLRALRARSLSVPDDVSLIAGSDSDLAALSTPPISVLSWSYRDLGERAAALMLSCVAGEQNQPPPEGSFAIALVERGSCAPPPRKGRR